MICCSVGLQKQVKLVRLRQTASVHPMIQASGTGVDVFWALAKTAARASTANERNFIIAWWIWIDGNQTERTGIGKDESEWNGLSWCVLKRMWESEGGRGTAGLGWAGYKCTLQLCASNRLGASSTFIHWPVSHPAHLGYALTSPTVHAHFEYYYQINRDRTNNLNHCSAKLPANHFQRRPFAARWSQSELLDWSLGC